MQQAPRNRVPILYFLRKKCPTPGHTNADNNTALIDLFIALPKGG